MSLRAKVVATAPPFFFGHPRLPHKPHGHAPHRHKPTDALPIKRHNPNHIVINNRANQITMTPSMNLMALARAYDLTTPPAADRAQLRQQQQDFLTQIEPLIPIVEPFVGSKSKRGRDEQNAFDALLSVVLDIGIDAFIASPLLPMLANGTSKREVLSAIKATPVRHGQLRPELETRLRQYRIVNPHDSIPSRRHFEARLYKGFIHFAIAPFLGPDKKKCFGPTVLHPLFLFR